VTLPNGVPPLLSHPDKRAELRHDPSRTRAVDEMLRYFSIVEGVLGDALSANRPCMDNTTDRLLRVQVGVTW
jgi:cytochrome P450